jgi:hypothetical protein
MQMQHIQLLTYFPIEYKMSISMKNHLLLLAALAPALLAQSGTSFPAGSLRPNLLSNPNLSSDQRTVNRWFDTSVFANPPAYQFGNSPVPAFAALP